MLGDVTNEAKPQQQQQARQRRALGDISNRAAPASSAGAKKDELPPVECLHTSDPAPPASFDLSSWARPEAVARAVGEHRAPIFGAAARGPSAVPPLVLEQVPPPSPWAVGVSPGPMPAFRGVPPMPFGLEAVAQLGRKTGRDPPAVAAPLWPCWCHRPALAAPKVVGATPSPFNFPWHEQAPPSPKMELDLTFAMLAPELSRLQVSTVDDSDEDMELED